MAASVSTDQRCSSQSRTAGQGEVGGAAEGTRSPGGTGPGQIRVQTQPEDLAATPGSAVPQWAYLRSHAAALRLLLFLSNRSRSCPSRFRDSQGGQWPGRAGLGSGASPLAGEELDGNTGSGSSSGVKIDLAPALSSAGRVLFVRSQCLGTKTALECHRKCLSNRASPGFSRKAISKASGKSNQKKAGVK